jgi:hypothetical protein
MSDRRKHLEFLRRTAKDAIWSGDYERALTLYEDGLALARSWKDRELEDLFTCNRATTLLEMDRQDFDLSRLKEIVLPLPGSPNAVLASYASAHAHEVRGEYSEGDVLRAERAAEEPRARARGVAGRVAQPAREPRAPREPLQRGARPLPGSARGLRGEGPGTVVRGRGRQRQPRLLPHRARRGLGRASARAPLAVAAREPRLAAGDGLSVPRPLLRVAQARPAEEAESWGVRALSLGKEFGRNDVVKNAHYLLAETYSEMGARTTPRSTTRRCRTTTRTSPR